MGNFYLHHYDIPFASINRIDISLLESGDHEKQCKLLTNLPNYKWKYNKALWNESRASEESRNRKHKRHDILGSQMPGTSEVVAIWRNILKTKDVTWLKDHRLDRSIVFPAAGYIAIAIEAVCQLSNSDLLTLPSCHLQNIHISKALVLSEEESDQGVEIQTTLHQISLSLVPPSVRGWQFSVTSIVDGQTTTHADGEISIERTSRPIRPELSIQSAGFEQHSVRSWYGRMSQAGLNFSGRFRSLTEISYPKIRNVRQVLAVTRLDRGGGSESESLYALHPATIDGILHAALIASADGILKDFRLRIPVEIGSMRIQMPPLYPLNEPLIIRGAAEPIELEAGRTLVEVSGRQHETFIQVKNCRLVIPFQSKPDQAQERHPMLKVSWKPDISRLEQDNHGAFATYCKSIPLRHSLNNDNPTWQELLSATDLIVHKNPGLRIAKLSRRAVGYHHQVARLPSIQHCIQAL